MKTKINIDTLRFIMSLFVVAIHIEPFNQINYNLDLFVTRILGRIAVPLFLCITGYYILEKAIQNKKNLKKYTIKILKLYFLCILIYLPIDIYTGKSESLILKDILVNGTFYHLWYFPALLTGLWITFYLIKKLGQKSLFVTIFLYIIGLFGDSYYGLIVNNSVLSWFYQCLFNLFDYTRNGIFLAPIFLNIGYLVKIKHYSDKKTLIYMILFFCMMCIESFILHYFKIPRHDSMYLFLPVFIYLLFKKIIKNKMQDRKLREVATSIYIIHPLIIIIVRFISHLVHLEKILIDNNLCLFMMVSLLSILSSLIILKIKNRHFKNIIN